MGRCYRSSGNDYDLAVLAARGRRPLVASTTARYRHSAAITATSTLSRTGARHRAERAAKEALSAGADADPDARNGSRS
jgi:hypothetical protein